MTLRLNGDRTLETTISIGTGNITTLGAVTDFRALSAVLTVNGDTAYATIDGGTEWEVVLITRVSATVYSRASTPESSSNSGAAVSFSAGTKNIWIDFPHGRVPLGGKGADIAAATTTILDNATGGLIDITGNTQIDAVTLSEGRTIWARFTGTPQITSGASLVVRGGTRTMVANDLARFDGYAAGVVRVSVLQALRLIASASVVLHVSTTGSDSANTGLSSGSPFATLQKAWNTFQDNYDMNGFQAIISLAAGSYTAGLDANGPIFGDGITTGVQIIGATATPESYVIRPTTSNALRIYGGAHVYLRGVTLDMQNSDADAVYVGEWSKFTYDNIVFGYGVNRYDIQAGANSMVGITGDYKITKTTVTKTCTLQSSTTVLCADTSSLRVGMGVSVTGASDFATTTYVTAITTNVSVTINTAANVSGSRSVVFSTGGLSHLQADPEAYIFSATSLGDGGLNQIVVKVSGNPFYVNGFVFQEHSKNYIPRLVFLDSTAVSTTATFSSLSAAVTLASGTGTVNGQLAIHPSIPYGTTISSGGGTTSIILSANTTAATSATPIAFGALATINAIPFAIYNDARLDSRATSTAADITTLPGWRITFNASFFKGSNIINVSAGDASAVAAYFNRFANYRGLCIQGTSIPTGTVIPDINSISGTAITISRPTTADSGGVVSVTAGGFAWAGGELESLQAPTAIGSHSVWGQDAYITSVVTPAALTATVNNYDPFTGNAPSAVLRLTTNGSNFALTGLAGGTEGRVVAVHNIHASASISLSNEDASSTAGNRFAVGATIVLGVGGSIFLRYDGVSSRWRLMTTPVNAGSFDVIFGSVQGSVLTRNATVWTILSPGTVGLPLLSAGAGANLAYSVLQVIGGGTGFSSYVVGDILQATTTTAFAKLAAVATGNSIISGGVGAVSTWGKIGLTTHITGTLAVSNGGTGLTGGTSGGVPYFSSDTAISSSLLLTQFGPLYGGGTAAAPVAMAAGTDGQIIVGQTGAAPLQKTMSGDATLAASGAITVADGAVTNAKSADMADTTIKGRAVGAGSGDPTDLTATQAAAIVGSVGGAMKSKVITFTRDTAAATGSVSYTGVGFVPSSLHILGSDNAAKWQSNGFADSSRTGRSLWIGSGILIQSSAPFFVGADGSNTQSATITSYDADGFTLSWVKAGTPTGTVTFAVICYR